MENEGDNETPHNWSSLNNPEKPGKETRGTEHQRRDEDCLDHSTAEISKKTQKNSGETRRLDATLNSAKDTN